MTIDKEEDRTPAESRAVAGAVCYLKRGEAGRELALAALTERGGYPAERAAAMVEAILSRRARRRAARTAAGPSGTAAGTAARVEACHPTTGAGRMAGIMLA